MRVSVALLSGFIHVLVFSDQELLPSVSFDFSDVKPTAFHEAWAKSGALDMSGSNESWWSSIKVIPGLVEIT